MNNIIIKNTAHSVMERLKNIAKLQRREHQDLILSYLIERFLYRMSASKHTEQFILKGALMLNVLGEQCTRATRDIDFMCQHELTLEYCKNVIIDIINHPVPDDGVIFDNETIKINNIQKQSRQAGVRVSFTGKIGTGRANLQLDIGPYYPVIPSPMSFSFPQLLNFGSPNLLGYSAESIIADKFEAMVSRDNTNTRLKDFYDVWILSTMLQFEMKIMKEAIQEIFSYYETTIPSNLPTCFTETFYSDKSKANQWKAFLKNAGLTVSESFPVVNQKVQDFLMPLCVAINQKSGDELFWFPANGWVKQQN